MWIEVTCSCICLADCQEQIRTNEGDYGGEGGRKSNSATASRLDLKRTQNWWKYCGHRKSLLQYQILVWNLQMRPNINENMRERNKWDDIDVAKHILPLKELQLSKSNITTWEHALFCFSLSGQSKPVSHTRVGTGNCTDLHSINWDLEYIL